MREQRLWLQGEEGVRFGAVGPDLPPLGILVAPSAGCGSSPSFLVISFSGNRTMSALQFTVTIRIRTMPSGFSPSPPNSEDEQSNICYM